jgi:lysyl-tRNA synthetase class I
MRNWIASEWFPTNARIELAKSIDSANFTTDEITFLNDFAAISKTIEWDEKTIQDTMNNLVAESELSSHQAFGILYQSLLQRERGPKLAPLLVELGQNNVNALLGSLN